MEVIEIKEKQSEFTKQINLLNEFLESINIEIIASMRGILFYDKNTGKYYRQIHNGIYELHIVKSIPYYFENKIQECDENGIVKY